MKVETRTTAWMVVGVTIRLKAEKETTCWWVAAVVIRLPIVLRRQKLP